MDVAIIRIGFIWLIIGGASQLALALCQSEKISQDYAPAPRPNFRFRASVGWGQVLYGFCGLNFIYETPFHLPAGFHHLTAVAAVSWLVIDPILLRVLRTDITTIVFDATSIIFALFLIASEVAAL